MSYARLDTDNLFAMRGSQRSELTKVILEIRHMDDSHGPIDEVENIEPAQQMILDVTAAEEAQGILPPVEDSRVAGSR
jgi:hypothetical protein